ncbi:phosphatidylglycerophosphatase A family protein [Haliovirga abyssi]|uniref:Phosphatidylglycerophosphatase A n=1 Tax=Haliovirga abyssi TaxID=2996794 RepID=A0AAU9DCK5_9FUSO|nr:phosphatidylglycerophosphatase A [Haliovirga abyssi]BDU50027.1 phosphatidylglycerophosphatase A [Haliovirga abyssi]
MSGKVMNDNTIKLLATWFKLGDIKKAPGTFGTLGAIPLGILIGLIPSNNLKFLIIMGFLFFSIYISDKAEAIYKEKDCQNIVIDEVLGYIVTIGFLPINFITVIGAFILFRIFDITKIYPINKLQDLKGGIGVVSDDFAAGLIANGILWIISLIIFRG